MSDSAIRRRMPAEAYIVYLRRIWSHPYVNERVAWPKLTALMWLIQYAQFSARVKHFRGQAITVAPGHFVASVRLLARRFGWSNPKVVRFLRELAAEQTVCAVSVTPAGTLYRFVNWELHQPVASSVTVSGTPSVTLSGTANPIVTSELAQHGGTDTVTRYVHSERTEKNKGVKKEGGKNAERTTWLTPYLDDWRDHYRTRIAAPGQAAHFLRAVHDELGPDECRARWRNYIATCPVDRASAKRFAETHTAYQVPGGGVCPSTTMIPGARDAADARKLRAVGF